MPPLNFPDYSYRKDNRVPRFPDGQPILILDGYCVLCMSGAASLMRWDKRGVIRYMPAQSLYGTALLNHYGVDWNETLVLLDQGKIYIKTDAYLRIAHHLGGLWRMAKIFGVLPLRWRDRLYDFVSAKRYSWFGQTDYCSLMPSRFEDRVIGMGSEVQKAELVEDESPDDILQIAQDDDYADTDMDPDTEQALLPDERRDAS